MSKSIRSSITINNGIRSYRLSMITISVDKKDFMRLQRSTTYIIVVEIAVIFTGFGFYGIAKIQRNLKEVNRIRLQYFSVAQLYVL